MRNSLLCLFSLLLRTSLTPLAVGVVFQGVTHAGPVGAQDILNQSVNIRVANQPLRQVLSEIERATNVRFSYRPKAVQADQRISLTSQNERLADVLDRLFTPIKIRYEVAGRQIILTPQAVNTPGPLSSKSYGETSQAEERPVSGKVTAENGEALAGVSVVLKGSIRGVTTNASGEFRIAIPDENGTLVFSFVGYETQEITVGNRTTLTVSMKPGLKALSEVVVVGYGTQTKANLTGAVASVGGEVLESRPLVNLAQGLQGLVPNLNINVNSGAPGRGATFNVRGTGSINGSDPLVLVDGVQMDPNLINPQDVASVTVLKDAASAAIYGVRGAYGVILITTKMPKKNAPLRVSYSGSVTMQTPTRLPKYVNSVDYIRMHREADATGAKTNGAQATEKFTDLDVENAQKYFNDPAHNLPVYIDPANPSKYRYVGNTDWIKEQYNGWEPMTDHTLSLSGGEGKTSFSASLGYLNQKGLIEVNKEVYKRYNAGLKINSDVNSWLTLNFRLNLNRTDNNRPTPANTGGTAESWLSNDLRPIMPVYHPDGNFAGQGSFTNPIALAKLNGRYVTTANDLWLTGGVTLRPLPGLQIVSTYTWNGYNANSIRHWKEYNEYGANGVLLGTFPWSRPSRVTEENNNDYYTAVNAYAEYTKTLADKHNFKGMVGFNQELKQTRYYSASAKNLIDQTMPAINLNNDPNPTVGGSRGEWAVSGTFFRLNYDYAGKYLVEINGRYDGTSRFPRDNRYVFLPSASVGWRVSDEAFFAPLRNAISDFKLRASYGKLGNQATGSLGNYPYLPTMSAGQVNYVMGSQLGIGVGTPGLVSSNFTWEKVSTLDFGVDFGFFRNRLTGSFDWYTRETRDMIVGAFPLPGILGTSPPSRNAGNLITKGWELSANWRDRINSDWSYDVTLSLSDNKTKITKYDLNSTKTFGGSNYYEGQNLNEIWGYETVGFFQTDDAAAKADQKQLFSGTWLAGDIQYKDLNGDGKITRGDNTVGNPGDQRIIGNSTPRYVFGVNANLRYKNFDFSFLIQGVGKRDMAVGGREFWGFTSEWNVPLLHHLNYWTPDNINAYYPRQRFGGGGNFATQTKYLQNAAYARLKNISLGYSLPKAVTDRLKLQNVRVYVTGQNLFEITSFYKALDPETVNQAVYPLNRAVSAGIQFGL
ncbi:SusC/RagA family TonB-linked outer membrane protein [Siphonobacter aquaeclarae]|uniref:TonB-linked outer membrane protein, SusC/RagA family n=1 Tax=Siphonobacter aquaeclarae TaxID=563176 RepID=A0A1G9HEW3_9BACT|nr:SusC/RagA family TonB-linked outer membrane protein [Siphonobacter aquaeclarae]SDL11386.1 TonB-linked outer membrane protein, SusC/RagA family [Siphonobacter aquaeclarae]